MDKRKIQRRGLHKNLNIPSTSQSSSVMDTDDIFLSSATSRGAVMSQRESNTDLLRKQIDSSTLHIIHSFNDTNKPIEQISTLKTSNNNTLEKSPIKKKIVSQQTVINNEREAVGGLSVDPIENRSNVNSKKSQNSGVTTNTQRNNTQNTPANNNQVESNVNKNYAIETSNFNNFLIDAGVTIDDETNVDCYIIDDDRLIIVKKMVQLLNRGDYSADNILQEWETHLLSNVKFLERCLNTTSIIHGDGNKQSTSTSLTMKHTKNTSLVRILLQVPQLQTQILHSLIKKLNETVVAADSMEDVPWTYQLLQQLRFIEIINDAELLTVKLEELLETSPMWFQRELITFLPDIVIDAQHENIAEILCRLMAVHSDLTITILDSITNLSLGKESQEELRNKMLNLLQINCHINKIPAIIRFCLTECTTIDSCQNVLRAIRALDLQPLTGENCDEYYTNQMLIVNAITASIILSSDMANAAVLVTSSTENSPKPFDIIMLLLLYGNTMKKKKADAIFKQHVKSGYYDAKLLDEFYNNYKKVASDLQPIALRMASNFLKLDDRILIEFSSEWIRQQFINHGHLIHKQREIIEKLILLMGNNDQTAKSALAILCKMTKTEDEKRYLQAHCNHLRILMEQVEKFNLEDVIILNDLLHALCANSNTVSDALRDDLFILLQKQLSCRRDSMTKCKGVAGAVMAIKHLAINPKCYEMAKGIFEKVLQGVNDCHRSQGFFYDKIGSVISNTPNIDKKFLKCITDKFEEQFINTYMTDVRTYSGELQATFGLNESTNDSEICVVQFGQFKYGGAIVPALLRLMGLCFMHVNDDESVENISALLGCPVLMPKNLDLPDSFTLDYLFHCINWFRELINIFVTQSDPLLQKQVSKRLDNIIDLQSELSNLLTIAETRYQPPSCYFHNSELPLLKQVEKKLVKKGKQRIATAATATAATVTEKSCSGGGSLLEHREKWETATLLSTKNPMYFRHLDPKILNIIDINITLSQSPSASAPSTPPPVQNNADRISTTQLCFIIKELLAAFDDDSAADEIFIRDLISLLPKICTKLQVIVNKLESENNDGHNDDDNNSNQNKQALRLVLGFLATIFRWKQFNNVTHNTILRDGLRILAGQIDKSNSTLGSCKKLVGESFKYFESLAHVATQIPIAFALVDLCKTLMKHSTSFTRQHQDKQAKMAYGFLCLEWPDDRHTGAMYKTAVVGLLNNWMDHERNPLDTVTSVMEWLPNEVKKMEKPHDKLATLPTINRMNFHHMVLKIFNGLINGIKISLALASTDTRKFELWRKVAENMQGIVAICKMITTRSTLLVYLRYMPLVLKQFLISGMPILEYHLRFQTEEIIRFLKMIQGATRYLNVVCVHSTEKKDLALTKLVPTAKTILEKLIYSVKGMLVLNNCSTAFWMGNLVNKNLDGREILSQTSDSTEGDLTSVLDLHTSDGGEHSLVRNGVDDGLPSDLLDSDDNNDMIIDDPDDDDDDDDDNDENNRVDEMSSIIDDH